MAVVKIKDNYCKGCLLCVPVCRYNSLEVSDSLNEQGLHPVRFKEDGSCDGCKKCAIMCPDVAIEIYN